MKKIILSCGFLLLYYSICFSQPTLETSKSTATYSLNESVVFRMTSGATGTYNYTIYQADLERVLKQGTVTGTQAITYTSSTPQAIICKTIQNGQTFEAGALIGQEELDALENEPSDFESFWNEQEATLARIPIDPQLTFLKETQYATSYKVSLATVNNRRVYGYIAIPKGDRKFPAMLQLPSAGNSPGIVQPGLTIAEQMSTIVMSISIHNAPADQIDSNAYSPDDISDENNMYYRLAVLACIRAIDYIYTLPSFDKQHVVLHGVSQGGGLSILTAGVDGRVSAVDIGHPALAMHNAPLYDQAASYPYYIRRASVLPGNQTQNMAAVNQATKYYDAIYAAKRFNGPVFISAGYLDDVCPPNTILAIHNNFRGKVILGREVKGRHNDNTTFSEQNLNFIRQFVPSTRNPIWPYGQGRSLGYNVDAGSDKQVAVGQSVTLSGKVYDDGSLLNLESKWILVDGDKTGFSIQNSNSPTTTASFTKAGRYVLAFQAEDTRDLSSKDIFYTLSDHVIINVSDSSDGETDGETDAGTDAGTGGGTGETPPATDSGNVSENYCSIQATFPWHEWIKQVKFGTINKTSDKEKYGDFTSISTSIARGQSQNLTIQPGLAYAAYQTDLYWRVWIDWNQDKQFTSDEIVLQKKTTSATVAGAITVPVTAKLGRTRMRISMRKDAYATSPCLNYSEGEVEDYAIQVTTSTTDVPVETIENPDTEEPVVEDNTTTNTGTYCTSKGVAPWFEWIAKVDFSDMSSSSDKSGYTDLTDKTANITQGKTYSIEAHAGLSWQGYRTDLYWRVWIDWNQDGTFSNSEVVASENGVSIPLKKSISVPLTAKVGATQMRIAMSRDAYANSCGNFQFGEVEDYNIIIKEGETDTSIDDVPTDDTTINDDTNNTNGEYCEIKATSPFREWIRLLRIAGFSNYSGQDGYGDYTLYKVNLIAGNQIDISAEVGLLSSDYESNLHWRIWADFNQDGDFYDASELVYQTKTVSKGIRTRITIPSSVNIGEVRIRVAVRRDAYPSVCGQYAFGEAEDYLLGIIGNADNEAPIQFRHNLQEDLIDNTVVYPNPAQGFFNIELPTINDTEVIIYNSMGQVVQKIAAPNQKMLISTTNWKTGLYWIHILENNQRIATQKIVVISDK